MDKEVLVMSDRTQEINERFHTNGNVCPQTVLRLREAVTTLSINS